MLGKLIKNEIKHSARYTVSVYLAVIAISCIMGLSLLSSSGFLGVVSCAALFIAGIVAIIVTLTSVIKNFYDSLFSRQGYLTLTLPVSCRALLASKLTVSFIWIVMSFLVFGLTVVMIFLYARERSSEYMSVISDAVSISGLLDFLPSTGAMLQFAVVFTLYAIINILTYVSIAYFTVAVANTGAFQSHPKALGGLVFLSAFFVNNSVGNLLTQRFPLSFNVGRDRVFFALEAMYKSEEALISYGVGGTVFSLIMAVGLMLLTGYILENKVNLK